MFGTGAHPTGLEVLLGVYAFAFQIFGDFAGYSNIARGTSKLMGIELSINFLLPVLRHVAAAQFWRNWHISLSEWLRDYLYIPLGGNRGGAWTTQRNLMITMVLGGLWHGAAWTFVLLGRLPGARAGRRAAGSSDAAERAGIRLGQGLSRRTRGPWRADVPRHLLRLADLPRRLDGADRQPDARVAARLARGTTRRGCTWRRSSATRCPCSSIHAWEARRGDLLAVLGQPMVWRYSVYAVVFYLTLLFGDFGGSQFIYFQF